MFSYFESIALITAITRLCCVITRHVQWFIRSANSQSLVSQKAAQFSAFKVNSEMAPPSVCLFVLCSVCMSFSCCTAIKAAILSMNSALIGGVCVYSWVMLCFFSGERAAVGAGRGEAGRLRRRRTVVEQHHQEGDVRGHALLDGARGHQASAVRHQGTTRMVSLPSALPLSLNRNSQYHVCIPIHVRTVSSLMASYLLQVRGMLFLGSISGKFERSLCVFFIL